jgi:hypothetical protein
MDKDIIVKIFSVENGLKQYDKIKIIRIKSKKYNLLIMEDYFPIIGEIDGSIDFESQGEPIKLENIIGFFMHKKNEFNLIIKEIKEVNNG